MGKVVETRWTCCNAVFSVEEDNKSGSKVFAKLFPRIENEPVTLQHTGPCPECAKRSLELREKEKKARDEAEVRRYERAEAALRQSETAGASNRESWERALGPNHETPLGPRDTTTSSDEDKPKRRLTLVRRLTFGKGLAKKK